MRNMVIVIGIALILFFALFFYKSTQEVSSESQKPEKPELELSEPSANSSVDRYADIDGVKIRYRVEGDNNKPALILIHGFTFSLETWSQLVPELEQDFQIILFDLPGHGLSGSHPQGNYSHDSRVGIVYGLIDSLKLNKPSLIGNSMGGNTAWRTAVSYPDLIDKLVLIGASGFPMNGLGDEPVPVPLAMQAYLKNAPKAGVTYAVKTMFSDPTKIPHSRIDQIVDMMQHDGNGEAFVKTFESFTLPDPSQMLAEIKAPSLILWGAKDITVPPAHAALFDQAIPDSKVIMLENIGHVAQEEDPALTAKIIKEFLSTP